MSLGYYRGNRQKQLADARRAAGIEAEPTPVLAPSTSPAPATSSTLTSREVSIASGYTGDPCLSCQSLTLRVSGHCYVCDTCGTTTGCS